MQRSGENWECEQQREEEETSKTKWTGNSKYQKQNTEDDSVNLIRYGIYKMYS